MQALSADEERRLGQAARDGDQQAREKLILANLPLVHYIIHRSTPWVASSHKYDDLCSEGTLALIESVDRWEPQRGRRLITLAYRRIRGAVLDASRDKLPLLTGYDLPEPAPRKPKPVWYQLDATAMVRQALQGRDRQVVTLCYGLGDEPPLTQTEMRWYYSED